MPSGACFCGQVGYSFQGEPAAKALCHCTDCQHQTGGAYTPNIIIPGAENFKVTKGTPKAYTVKADSGNEVTSFFCGNCGTTMWREGKTFGDAHVIRVGTLDDKKSFETFAPAVELYTVARPSWQKEVAGTDQKTGMP